jgi:hypothetical protein
MTVDEDRINKAHQYQQRRAAQLALERNAYLMYLRGRPIEEIADFAQVPVARAKVFVSRQREVQEKRHSSVVEQVRRDHKALNDLIQAELVDSWFESKGVHEEVVSGNAGINNRTGELVPMPDRVTTKYSAGNPAYLLAAIATNKDTRKIIGADRPDQIQVTITDEEADAQLRARMEQLILRSAPVEPTGFDGEPQLRSVGERQRMVEQVQESAAKKHRDLIGKIPASVRAETATAGVDVAGDPIT